MSPRVLGVDDDGIRLAEGFHGSLDVHFDGRRAWSVALERDDRTPYVVSWPKRLQSRLDGRATVVVTAEGEQLFADEVSFGSGEGRLELVDRHGVPIVIDKWGLAQRTFETRRESGAVEAMTSMAERVLAVMREECGLEGWISFGTLLGAARSGSVIGHDSDIDLCFLSDQPTPAQMAVELWGLARALQDAGIEVKHKTASFITVVYEAPDGGEDGIDIYTCFYVGDLLHETATVRERVPRSAILPLTTLEFEGRPMPAPADPDRMLAVSYGPGWRVPDPSFRHLPGPEITDRFDAWFGSLMTHRREWTQANGQEGARRTQASPFAHWVVDRLGPQDRVLELGTGAPVDLRYYGERGHRAIGYDYAHPGRHALGVQAVRLPDGVGRRSLNLLDLRDALTAGALAARQGDHRNVVARRLLEALPPRGREAFWAFTRLALREGGRAYLEGVSRSPEDCRASGGGPEDPPRPWSVDPHDVAAAAVAAGGEVVHREGFATASRACRGGAPARWRMIVSWQPAEERVN